MIKHNHKLFVLILLLLATSLACNFSDLITPTPKAPPTEEVLSQATSTETEDVLPTDTPEPTVEPTPEPPNRGQIAYIKNGNVWRYIVETGEDIQVTTDGIADDFESEYHRPMLSSDGQNLSYEKSGIYTILNLVDNSVIDLSPYERIIKWAANPDQFYVASGDLVCPEIENLEDQELINFDVLRYTLGSLDSPHLLANISGGLYFPQTISNDEQYLNTLSCACYSECGEHILWHLPSNTIRPPDIDIYAGKIDYSPNSLRLAVSPQQIYGYTESPLYLANSDFTGLTEIFHEPGVAAIEPLWSPTGEWIAFTAIIIGPDGFNPANSQVILTNSDGSVTNIVDGSFALLIDWSPDGTQLIYNQNATSTGEVYLYDLVTNNSTLLPALTGKDMDWGNLP